MIFGEIDKQVHLCSWSSLRFGVLLFGVVELFKDLNATDLTVTKFI